VWFSGKVGKARISGWLDKSDKWIQGFSVRFDPDLHKLLKIDDLESARAYARSIGVRENVIRLMGRQYAQQVPYVDAYGSALMLGTSLTLPFSEYLADAFISVYRDGKVEITVGVECY